MDNSIKLDGFQVDNPRGQSPVGEGPEKLLLATRSVLVLGAPTDGNAKSVTHHPRLGGLPLGTDLDPQNQYNNLWGANQTKDGRNVPLASHEGCS